MNDKVLRAEAERCANELIQELKITSLPIDPIKIASDKGILTQAMDSEILGVSGFLMKQDDNFGIGYSTRLDNEGLIHFTVAHELGHYMLPGHVNLLFGDGSTIHKSKSGFISSDKHEKQADYFAATLLMPEEMVIQQLRRIGDGFTAIENLARCCKTSLTATAIRYAQLAEIPAAVIVSSGNVIDYCFISPELNSVKGLTWIKKGDYLPSGTATERFNDNPDNISQSKRDEKTTSLDVWFDGPEVELCEDVVGLGAYGKTLTVLFTTDAIDEDDENDDEEFERRWHRR